MSTEISIFKLLEMFPDEASAEAWFEKLLWPEGVRCPGCESDNIQARPTRKPLPYRCRSCRMDFSVRTGTLLHRSHLPLRKWVFAIYLICRPKGIASTQLARDLGVTQKTAWYLGHRIRQACLDFKRMFLGTVEVDETYMGGKKKNKHRVKGQKFGTGGVDKVPVIGVYERHTKKIKTNVLDHTGGAMMRRHIYEWVHRGMQVCSDEHVGYKALAEDYYHEFVRHGAKQYVKGIAHTNSLENFWSLFKRGYMGTYHVMSPKHLWRYAREFTARHNARPLGVYGFMQELAQGMRGQRLTYQELITYERPFGAPFIPNPWE